MTQEKDEQPSKKPYDKPSITVHGDVEAITLGDELGEELDATFTTSARGRKKPKKNRFS